MSKPGLDRLPLSSVRTFVIVGRLLSISRAAEELHVTASAVSHQIKALEDYLGETLLQRDHNKISLTQAGQQYMTNVAEGLAMLGRATRMVKRGQGDIVINLSAPPSLAVLWLVKRLNRFLQQYPDVLINVTPLEDSGAIGMLQGAFDVGFFDGTGAISHMNSVSLGENCVFPICRADLTQGERGIREAADLERQMLLKAQKSLTTTMMKRGNPDGGSGYEARGSTISARSES